MTNRKKLVWAICDYLQSSLKDGSITKDDSEGVEGFKLKPFLFIGSNLINFF